MDCWTAASKDLWSAPVESPLAGIRRLARIISILEASFSLMGSWEAAEGFVASVATPFVTSASSLFAPSCSATFRGLLEGEGLG